MCLTGAPAVLAQLRGATAVALRTVPPEESGGDALFRQLSPLLAAGRPLVVPLSFPSRGQVTPGDVIRREVRAYPALLAEVIGPPLQVGQHDELAHVVAECALAALRLNEVQGTLAMLFLTTLCAPVCTDVAAEVIGHLLDETDRGGSLGLLALGAKCSGIGEAASARAKWTLARTFATTAVQILGTWGRHCPPTGD